MLIRAWSRLCAIIVETARRAELEATSAAGRPVSVLPVKREEPEKAGNLESNAAEDLRSDDRAPMSYDQFLAERQRIVDARQRAQQRIDQLVSAGAVGALVLSITFLEKIAPTPVPRTLPVLFAAWVALACSLGSNFVSHYASERAFENFLTAFDRAFLEGRDCALQGRAARLAKYLAISASVLFVVGVVLLAWFAFDNLSHKLNAATSSTAEPVVTGAPASLGTATGATAGADARRKGRDSLVTSAPASAAGVTR